MTLRDKKGKGKEVSEEESKWSEAEKKWLRAFKPDEDVKPAPKGASGAGESAEGDSKMEDSTAEAPPPPKEEDEDAEDDDEAEPPFLLLLSVFTAPPPTPRHGLEEPEENPNLVTPLAPPSAVAPATSPSKPPPRKYYLIHPSLTLKLALASTTQLEYPSFELWSREAFLRARLMGKIEVVDKPTELRSLAPSSLSGGSWGRGRGRGRGRGGAGGRGGRGGREGGQGGREGHPRMEEPVAERVSDGGWGKRGAVTAVPSEDMQEQREEKRPRMEDAAPSAMPPAPAAAAIVGLGGLVGYDSD